MARYTVVVQSREYPKARSVMRTFAKKRVAQKFRNRMEELRLGDNSKLARQAKFVIVKK